MKSRDTFTAMNLNLTDRRSDWRAAMEISPEKVRSVVRNEHLVGFKYIHYSLLVKLLN